VTPVPAPDPTGEERVPFAPADPSRLMLTPEQRADDASPDPMLEALAVHLYESDWESDFNTGDDVEWRYNYAHRDRYRDLARAALEFVHVSAR
jgi:hypothetical protein